MLTGNAADTALPVLLQCGHVEDPTHGTIEFNNGKSVPLTVRVCAGCYLRTLALLVAPGRTS